MANAKLRRTDVSKLPDALRLAEEVQRTRQAQVLERDGEELAVLMPVQPGSRRRGRKGGAAKAANPNDWLLNLIGITDSSAPPDGPTDVSANKHKYLAEALYGKAHPAADR